MRISNSICLLACTVAGLVPVHAQLGRNTEWVTTGYDAQRSSWVRTDPKISPSRMQKPGFDFLWKMQLATGSDSVNALTAPIILDRLIGYKGFRALAFVGGSADKIYVLDSDLARMEWQNEFKHSGSRRSSDNCPAGVTSGLARTTVAAIMPAPGAGQGQGGRGSAAKSGVGQPGQGAVTLALSPAPRRIPVTPENPVPSAPGRPARPQAVTGFGRSNQIYVISADGTLHSLNTANGADFEPSMKFLPAGASASGLVVMDQVAYAATDSGCGGAASGVWAADLIDKKVASWTTSNGIAGTAGPAFGPDGTVYVATKGGEVVSLEPVTLKQLAVHKASGLKFTSSPVIFDAEGKALLAVAASDGALHIIDTANLAGPELAKSAAFIPSEAAAPTALASWQDTSGTRYILAAVSGAPSGVQASNGSVSKGAVVAWKLQTENGSLSLQPGWVSRDLVSPATPMIINGVVFALATGEDRSKGSAKDRAKQSVPAVLYALDGGSGKELWNSGNKITSYVHGDTLSGGASQVYATAHDGSLYAFGFPIEH